MKKVFLLVASALLATGAFAQATIAGLGKFGFYNVLTEQWVGDGWAGGAAINQKATIAVEVNDPEALAWLAAVPGRTIALADFRSHISQGAVKANVRLQRLCSTSDVYVIDVVLKQLFAAVPGIDTYDFSNPDNEGTHFHLQLTGADVIGTSTWDYNKWEYTYVVGNPATGADVAQIKGTTPAENLDVIGIATTTGSSTQCTINNAIGDVTVDGKIIVGYYSILGVKLDDAPATGIFIEKYSDGTSAKIVK